MLLQETRASANRLIDSLSAPSRKRLLSAAETVQLEARQTLVARGADFDYVHFPVASVISMMLPADRGRLEVGIVGREGFLGLAVALGAGVAEFDGVVQGPGLALRVAAPRFRALLRDDSAMRLRVNRYAYVVLGQMARNVACHRFHLVEQRLARWLLASADRAQSAMFDVTHAVLAEMLGVRRVGVTNAAHALQARGLIAYSRGNVAIRDRDGLKRAACGCYRDDLDAYRRHLE